MVTQRIRWRTILIASVALTLAAAGAGFAQTATYELNVILSTTGAGAFLGRAELQDLQAIEAQTNRSGGIQGRPLKFTVVDDQTNPQVTVQLVNGLVAKRAALFLGPGISATCKATLPLLSAGPVSYCFSPAIHPPTGSSMFSSTVSTDEITAALIRYCRGRGWTRIAVIGSTDATGQDVSQTIEDTIALPENKGMQIVDKEQFGTGDLSVVAQISRIKAANPQVLLTTSSGTPFGTILAGIHDVGLDLPVFSNGANMTFAQMGQYGALLPRDLFFSGIRGITPETGASPGVTAAQKAYFAAFAAQGVRPDFGHALAWDATQIVVDALKHLGADATSSQVRDYIAKLKNWPGITGTYDFQKYPQRGLGPDAAIVYRWDVRSTAFVVASRPAGAPI
jgi:branched-chain amino acid transport system substrate-binding protein